MLPALSPSEPHNVVAMIDVGNPISANSALAANIPDPARIAYACNNPFLLRQAKLTTLWVQSF